MRYHLLPALVLVCLVGPAFAAEPTLVVKPDAFQTLVNPMCSHCRDEAKRREGELRDDDRVLCWIRGYSDGGAIPYRFFLNPYRVISDTYGVFVYDPDAGYARGFAPSLEFTFHGWRNGVMVMKHKDGTLFSCLTGLAFDGPKKGEKLKPVPTLVSDWGFWLKRYPQNVAYHMFEKYKPVELPKDAHEDSLKSRAPADKRLASEAMVLGVTTDKATRAYPLADVEKAGLLNDKFGGENVVILWHGPTKTAVAYTPLASPPKKGPEPRTVTLSRDDKNPVAPFIDKETGSRWDIAGRAVDGELKDWTLQWLDSVMVKWFAWAAEYPQGELFTAAKVGDKMKEVAGSAEFLRGVPKHFAQLKAIDVEKRQVTLLIDGEKVAKVWPVTQDAEVKINGWWGRLDQFKPGDRVYTWFKQDRSKQPVAVFMLADEISEQDLHGKTSKDLADLEAKRTAQKKLVADRWMKEGLPGQVAFVHISGELELLLDHEAIRWGRSLKPGDEVKLSSAPPIQAVVKAVSPWRERTLLRLVVNGTEPADLIPGQRMSVMMTTPPSEVLEGRYPPDMGRPRSRDERVEWFLATIYCPCKVGKDTCTGQFYTLSSCNPNGCGLPNAMRKSIGEQIDKGLSDRQILDELIKDHGQAILNPHLLP